MITNCEYSSRSDISYLTHDATITRIRSGIQGNDLQYKYSTVLTMSSKNEMLLVDFNDNYTLVLINRGEQYGRTLIETIQGSELDLIGKSNIKIIKVPEYYTNDMRFRHRIGYTICFLSGDDLLWKIYIKCHYGYDGSGYMFLKILSRDAFNRLFHFYDSIFSENIRDVSILGKMSKNLIKRLFLLLTKIRL